MNREQAWSATLTEIRRLPHWRPVERETVPNGSFERGQADRPEGWHLVSGTPGPSTEWLDGGGVDGKRCLRLSPRGGGASWLCSPIPIVAGREYLFRCAIKRDGNRHWAHACKINWVSLVFLDAARTPCDLDPDEDSPLVSVRCRKTDGWVEAGRQIVAPAGSAFLVVGFRIERGQPDLVDDYGFRKFWHGQIDSGNWWIDHVRLEPLPRGPIRISGGAGCLAIELPQGAGRIRVADGAGKTFSPAGGYTYSEGGGCFHVRCGKAQLVLPPGRYTVEVMRGFQREVFRRELELREGSEVSLRAETPAIQGWPVRGYYMGDHHNHLSFHGETRHPMMTINDLYRVARGEGLDYVSFCGEIVDQYDYADWRDSGRARETRPDGAFEREDFVCAVSHEVTQDLLGHLCLVNAPGRVHPGHPWWITPTNAEVYRRTHSVDGMGTLGAVAMAHPYDGLKPETVFQQLADPSVTSVQREMPVDAALGLVDTMDFLVVEPAVNLEMRFRDYYRLLNLGLHIGVSASSDAYADQGTEIIGGVRTVVQAESLSMDAIALGYRRRRTQATNGPLILFSVNGGAPGDRVPGATACWQARAYSNWGLTRLEIVCNGEVIADATASPDGWARIEGERHFDRSGWLVARAYGPGHRSLNVLPVPADQRSRCGQCCVTSPIYIEVPGRPPRYRREDTEYFIRWIDASCEAIRRRKAYLTGQGPDGPVMTEVDVQAALALFAEGREFYLRRLNACE